MAAQMQEGKTSPILSPPQSSSPSPSPSTFKPAFGLHLLRDYVLTPQQFDYALRQFSKRWAYKSATPQIFFRTLEDATGTELSWFWKGWFATTWHVDLAVKEIAYPENAPQNGARITFGLEGPMPMPIRARVTLNDGTKRPLRLPVDVWRDGPTHTLQLDTTAPLQRVEIDPTNKLPDTNLSNNTWTGPSP